MLKQISLGYYTLTDDNADRVIYNKPKFFIILNDKIALNYKGD